MSRVQLAVLLVNLGLIACAPPAAAPPAAAPPALAPAPVPVELPAPGAEGAAAPSLALLPDGRVLLSWVEPAAEGRHALRFATRAPGAAWSEPHTIAEGGDWFVNWADFPSVNPTPDGSLFAHWLAKSASGSYTYDVTVSISRDAGESWGEPFVLHRDGTHSEHGFVSMLPVADARMGFVWLDGRNTVDATGAALGHDAGAEMSLYFTEVAATGERGEERALDGRVCDCCQTAAARSGETLLAVYRDRSPEEVRDMSIVRRTPQGWSAPADVIPDGWRIDGCPVNGPALDADASGRTALAWFAAPEEKPAVRASFSADAGASWSQAIPIDEGRPLGRVDVALLPGGGALVSWLEQSDDAAELRLRRVDAQGGRSPSLAVATTQIARSSGFPRLVVAGDELVLAWRDASDPGRLRTAVARLSGS